MRVTIVQGGQTGGDRGAAIGALVSNLPLTGAAPQDWCDEYGPIPRDVAACMYAAKRPGLAARTRENVDSAHGLIIVAANRLLTTPGSKMTHAYARKREIPRLVVQGVNGIDGVAIGEFLADLESAHPGTELRLMIAGPRASKWPYAYATALELVHSIAGL